MWAGISPPNSVEALLVCAHRHEVTVKYACRGAVVCAGASAKRYRAREFPAQASSASTGLGLPWHRRPDVVSKSPDGTLYPWHAL
ncbi:MAG TPA: hypothetical protein VGN34_08760 [Ktedonobacteraceae bacterium]